MWLYLSFINIKELDFWPLMSSSKKLANYQIRALRGDLAQFRDWKMKIWPQIQAKMASTQFSPIAGYYHGDMAATDMRETKISCSLPQNVFNGCIFFKE